MNNYDNFSSVVNINTLQCAANESSIESQVCGSDGVTYSSTCTLLQTTVDVRIAHSGACENDECTSMGEVSSAVDYNYVKHFIFISYRFAVVME